jgi:hypothetical protein
MTCLQFLLIMAGIVFGILALLVGRKVNGGLAATLPAVVGIVLSTGTILLAAIMIAAAMAH